MFTGSIITVIVMATKFMPACVCVLIKVILSDVCAEPSSIVVCTFDKNFGPYIKIMNAIIVNRKYFADDY